MAIAVGTVLNHIERGPCIVSKIERRHSDTWVWFHELGQNPEFAVWQTEDEILANPGRYQICDRDPTSLAEGDEFIHTEFRFDVCVAVRVDEDAVEYRRPDGAIRVMTNHPPGPWRNGSLRNFVRAILTRHPRARTITTTALAEPESIFPPWR